MEAAVIDTEALNPSEISEAESGMRVDLVIVGHVDHGKSTVIGRLMVDTGSLPKGKLEQVRRACAQAARPFEYAFLLDALKGERAQGITIDTARCFFHTANRDYVIHDAPGHVEFLKNMVTGAARADAACLVIDAAEGIQENSKRHGFILSMLGIRQVAILVNKMDLVEYREDAFLEIRSEYTGFLANLGLTPMGFIPISARHGENIATHSKRMPWYSGPIVLEQIECFRPPSNEESRPFRLPIQDVYKFTEQGDNRRIVVGTLESGTVQSGDTVVFLPSSVQAKVRAIEAFPGPVQRVARTGQAIGLTLTSQVYVKPGELACKANEPQPKVASRFRASLFWMGHAPLVRGKRYKLKIGAARVPVELVSVLNVLDASELASVRNKGQVERHDVAEVVLESTRPVGFDCVADLEQTSRFVIVDGYEIAGCGTVLAEDTSGESLLLDQVRQREYTWETGAISRERRAASYGHVGKFVVVTAPLRGDGDPAPAMAQVLAKNLERRLFSMHNHTYYLSVGNVFDDLRPRPSSHSMDREEHIIQLGQLARVITDSGLLFITALIDADQHDLEKLKILNEPNELFVVSVGDADVGQFRVDVRLGAAAEMARALELIIKALRAQRVIPEYSI